MSAADIACPKCQSKQWHATGETYLSTRQLQRAVLRCDRCRNRFTSGLPKALEAAAAERGDCALTPAADDASALRVPQPSLPIEGTTTRQDQGFVTADELARRRRSAGYRRRASGGD